LTFSARIPEEIRQTLDAPESGEEIAHGEREAAGTQAEGGCWKILPLDATGGHDRLGRLETGMIDQKLGKNSAPRHRQDWNSLTTIP
jgi:hypothetical protein